MEHGELVRGESGKFDVLDVENLEIECSVGDDSKVKLSNDLNFEVKLRDDSSDPHLNSNVGAKCIDLNLNVEADFNEAGVETRRIKERSFDLNLGFDEENKDELNGESKGSEGFHMIEKTPEAEKLCGFVEETLIECSVQNGNCFESIEGGSVKEVTRIPVTVLDDDASNVASTMDYQDDTGSSHTKGKRGRKRKNLSVCYEPANEPMLRRSNRKGSVSNHVLETVELHTMDNAPEEKPDIFCGDIPEEPIVPEVILQLPPSSESLNIEGVSVLDILSIYSCLRSFSYSLFLSPFNLEDFVAAIKNESANSLFDFIHFSLLQTLWKHLEFLSKEGSQSASYCLRCLDWGLLDLITWPLFAVEYLLIHSSTLRPEFDVKRFKLFECDYYKQPTHMKVEILRCLCDDVIDVEVIISELNRRSSAAELAVDGFDRNVNLGMYKKRRVTIDGFSISEEIVDETLDWNSDECCLCKMEGSLICCDGCPAAYHSRCAGVASDLLPEGEWYCPECLINKEKPWMNIQKALRGADLLGHDPHNRIYFTSCGYLLVLESFENESSINYYHRDDLNSVIQALRSCDIRFGCILQAISRHWDLPVYCNQANGSFNLNGNLGKAENKNIQGSHKHGEDLLPGSTEMLSHNESEVPGTSAVSSCLSSAINKMRDSSPVDISTTYINYYYFGQAASSVAEGLMHKSLDKSNSIYSLKTTEEIISTQLMAISKKYSKFCWPDIPNISVQVWKETCGWCYSCKSPEDGRDCLVKMNIAQPEPVQEGIKRDMDDIQSEKNKKGHLVTVICRIMCIEYRLRGLLLGPWMNPHYSMHWRKSVLNAHDVASMKKPLLSLESNLRTRALSAEWLKHEDSANAMGSASHVVTSSVRVASKLRIERKRGKHSESDSVQSSKAVTGLTLYWWRGGRISRPLFNWKGLPHFLARKAARQFGCTKIPGVLYSENSEFAKRNKNVAWRASVETATSSEQLAFLVRDLDSNIRWDEIENTPSPSKMGEFNKLMRPFKKVILRRKSIEGTVVKYLLDFGKRRIIPDIVVKQGSMLEESSSGRKKFWLEESHVPLHLLKSFEDKQTARKGNKMIHGNLFDGGRVKNKPSKSEGFIYLFSRAERSENYQCGHCNKVVLIREAVSCQYCEGFFHKRHAKKSAGSIIAEGSYTCHKCQEGKHVRINLKGKMRAHFSKKASLNNTEIHSKAKKKVRIDRPLVQSRSKKVVADVPPLRRSARKLKVLTLQKKKTGGVKKRKQGKSKNMNIRKSADSILVEFKKRKKGESWQKKRTAIYPSFWLRGLLFSKKTNDEKMMDFRMKKLVLPSEDLNVIVDSPKCSICSELKHTATLNYICCEICEDWFHGDAFGLDSENVNNLIGFRCHACLKKVPPFCPHLQSMKSDGAHSGEVKSNGEVDYFERVAHTVPSVVPQGLLLNQNEMFKSKFEAESGDTPLKKRQKTDVTENLAIRT